MAIWLPPGTFAASISRSLTPASSAPRGRTTGMTTPWWPVTRARAVRQASRAGAECKCSLSACSSSANRANWSSESSGRCCAGGSHRETGCRRLESRVGAWVHGRGDRESSDQQLRNVIENPRKHGKRHEPCYLAAMEELARRKGLGLDFQKSLDWIRKGSDRAPLLVL